MPENTQLARIEMGVLTAGNPRQMIEVATDIARQLQRIVTDCGLARSFARGQRPYVQCEGWTTLAAMLGYMPREVSMVEHDEGAWYECTVELRRMSDGAAGPQASAECGRGEPNWQIRGKQPVPAYARRSMAATRATGKACRLAFSWVMVLAGYAPTPAEEIEGISHEQPQAEAPPLKPKAAAVSALRAWWPQVKRQDLTWAMSAVIERAGIEPINGKLSDDQWRRVAAWIERQQVIGAEPREVLNRASGLTGPKAPTGEDETAPGDVPQEAIPF